MIDDFDETISKEAYTLAREKLLGKHQVPVVAPSQEWMVKFKKLALEIQEEMNVNG